ncbi:MAG: hypothetical protein PUP92_02910 [Rhizonema sp. PD38]|nr:hypothetical protein [Rhizonema sp. PD38]
MTNNILNEKKCNIDAHYISEWLIERQWAISQFSISQSSINNL